MDHVAQVVAQEAAFEARNTNIIAISFGRTEWAEQWLDDMQFDITLWLDEDRLTYEAFGLGKSRTASWGLKNMSYYAKAKAEGREINRGHRGDTHQLGGDFIVDRHGKLRFSYPSSDPTDRPKVETLLGMLATLD